MAQPSWPPRMLAASAGQVALVHMLLGDAAAFRSSASLMLDTATRARSTRYVFRAKVALADAHAMAGMYEHAIPMLQSLVGEARASAQPTSEAVALAMLCAAHVLVGDLERARDTAAQAWPLAVEQDVTDALLDQAVLMAALEGRHEMAARLLGFARRPSEMAAPATWINAGRLLAKAEAVLTAALQAASFADLREQGARLSVEAGLALLEDVILRRA
jgi:hypothetical protein